MEYVHVLYVYMYFRARSLYSTVDDSSDELKIGPTRKKNWQISFYFIFSSCIFYLLFFFSPTSQNNPCRDLSTVEYSECALNVVLERNSSNLTTKMLDPQFWFIKGVIYYISRCAGLECLQVRCSFSRNYSRQCKRKKTLSHHNFMAADN